MQFVTPRFLSSLVLVTTALGASLPTQSAAQERKVVASEPGLNRGSRTDVYGEPLPPGVLARMGTLRDYIGEGSSRIIFSPDGRFVTATSEFIKPPLRLWDPETGRVVRDLKELAIKGIGIRHVAFSSDGKLVAAADSAGTVRLGSTDTGRKIREFPGHDDIWEIALSGDGKILRVWHGRTVWFWNIAAGTRTHWHSMTGDQPGALRHLLDVVSLGRSMNYNRRPLNWHTRILFRPNVYIALPSATSLDGKVAASIGSPGYRLWDVATGRHLQSIPRHREPRGLIIEYMEDHIEFSPDGKLLAAGVSACGTWPVELCTDAFTMWTSPRDSPSRPMGSDWSPVGTISTTGTSREAKRSADTLSKRR